MNEPSIHTLLNRAAQRLKQAGCDSPRREARHLLASASDLSADRLLLEKDEISLQQQSQFESLLARREAREPLAQILGSRPFWSLDFSVNCHTLSPRPESETLIEAVLSLRPDVSSPVKILDLGTGTGCLLLTLLHEYKQAVGVGIDISENALKVARQNAAALNLQERVSFRKGNWMEEITERFDIVISNPPYIKTDDIAELMPEVREFEPHLALDGGADGLEPYRRILEAASDRLKESGVILFEHGKGQADAIAEIAHNHAFDEITRYPDLADIDRAIAFRRRTDHLTHS